MVTTSQVVQKADFSTLRHPSGFRTGEVMTALQNDMSADLSAALRQMIGDGLSSEGRFLATSVTMSGKIKPLGTADPNPRGAATDAVKRTVTKAKERILKADEERIDIPEAERNLTRAQLAQELTTEQEGSEPTVDAVKRGTKPTRHAATLSPELIASAQKVMMSGIDKAIAAGDFQTANNRAKNAASRGLLSGEQLEAKMSEIKLARFESLGASKNGRS